MSRSRDLAAVRTQPATTTLGTSNYRAGVNAGNSIASGGNYNVTLGDEAGTAITQVTQYYLVVITTWSWVMKLVLQLRLVMLTPL